MKVILDNHTPLWVCAQGIRQCWASQDKSDTKYVRNCMDCESININDVDNQTIQECEDCGSINIEIKQICGPKDRELINRIANKYKHASTLEHLTYNFTIEGVSRALLQELARHRMASPSVKSTRYTLKELKDEESFDQIIGTEIGWENSILFKTLKERASEFLVFTEINSVDLASIKALENLRLILLGGTPNDRAKYCLPESYKVDLAWTINARSLQNFISLRSSKAALWEIRDLANAIFNALPEDHKYLFEDLVNE